MNSGITTQNPVDFYARKTVEHKAGKRTLKLELPVSGFSSHQIDRGSMRLLREIEMTERKWERVLDVGCGAGAISLHLAASGLAERAVGIDRDMVSVEFACRNAANNGIGSCEFLGGLAYHDAPSGPYSAILSNVPAKAGEGVHRHMLLNSSALLAPEGEVWIVVVKALERETDEILKDERIEVKKKIHSTSHIVYAYAFREKMTFDQDPYAGESAGFVWGDYEYEMNAVADLPEADDPGPETSALMEYVTDLREALELGKVAICDPGNGHLAAGLEYISGGKSDLSLIGRDILALRLTAANAAKLAPDSKVDIYLSAGYWDKKMGKGLRLFLGILNEKEGIDVFCRKVSGACRAVPGVPFIFAGSNSYRVRMLKEFRQLGIKAAVGRERKGTCILCCALEEA